MLKRPVFSRLDSPRAKVATKVLSGLFGFAKSDFERPGRSPCRDQRPRNVDADGLRRVAHLSDVQKPTRRVAFNRLTPSAACLAASSTLRSQCGTRPSHAAPSCGASPVWCTRHQFHSRRVGRPLLLTSAASVPFSALCTSRCLAAALFGSRAPRQPRSSAAALFGSRAPRQPRSSAAALLGSRAVRHFVAPPIDPHH
jgi:hypothetical protein